MRSSWVIRYQRHCEFRTGGAQPLLDETIGCISTHTVEIPAKAGIWCSQRFR
jgi:hypothetical protein